MRDGSGDAASALGERFARAIGAQDAAELRAVMRDDIDFRALTPGRAWEADAAAAVVDDTILGTWFPPDCEIVDVIAVETSGFETMHRVGYRFRGVDPDGAFTVEQQAFYAVDGDRIAWLRILCSGFVPDASN